MIQHTIISHINVISIMKRTTRPHYLLLNTEPVYIQYSLISSMWASQISSTLYLLSVMPSLMFVPIMLEFGSHVLLGNGGKYK